MYLNLKRKKIFIIYIFILCYINIKGLYLNVIGQILTPETSFDI